MKKWIIYECSCCRATMCTLGKGKPTGCTRCLAPASAIDFYRATPRAA